MLKPGGRFGFVEHVAADQGSALERTQLVFDPVQQVVAGNCHLHRNTDKLIAGSVAAGLFSRIEEPIERYIVPRMWWVTSSSGSLHSCFSYHACHLYYAYHAPTTAGRSHSRRAGS